MNFSASDLIKRSAMQICYLRNNPAKREVTEQQLVGNRSAKTVTTGMPEMAGKFEFEDSNIYFSWDEVVPNKICYNLIEHKYVSDQLPDWYLQSSLLQAAVYGALTLQSKSKKLQTAKFAQKQGVKYNSLLLKNLNLRFKVQFTGKKQHTNALYRVRVIAPKAIINFLIEKANASRNYNTAKIWDSKYKYKEFQNLSKFFTFEKV